MTTSSSDLDFVPGSPFLLGQQALLHAGFQGQDLNPLGNRIVAHLGEHPEDAVRYMDLSFLMQVRGDEVMADKLQMAALSLQRHYRIPTTEGEPALRLLALMAPGNFMANTPLEFLVSGSEIGLETLYLMPGEPLPQTLPPHDVLFVAIGESAATQDLLAELGSAVDGWHSPLLNNPLHSLCLARDTVSLILNGEAGISMPLTARVSRTEALAIAGGADITGWLADGQWPLIVRPVDSHAGKELQQIADSAALGEYLAAHDEIGEFYVSSFIDYRSADGLFRKYRIVFIEGQPFLCHMAISSNWMVHYLNADMTERQERRDEEARVMQNFDQDFAARHKDAFARLHDAFPLDYFGIDCGETPDGELLIFEVDTGMIVHAMDPVDMFPYKQGVMQRVFDAFQAMVRKSAGHPHA